MGMKTGRNCQTIKYLRIRIPVDDDLVMYIKDYGFNLLPNCYFYSHNFMINKKLSGTMNIKLGISTEIIFSTAIPINLFYRTRDITNC